MKRYELKPDDSHKSFYGKAFVEVDDSGMETLFSYNTPIIRKAPNGAMKRLWDGWSATTGRHIRAFAGINKKEYEALPG